MDPLDTAASCAFSASDDILDLVSLLCLPKTTPLPPPLLPPPLLSTSAQFYSELLMSSPTNTPPTPTSTITIGMLGEDSSPASRATHTADHNMAATAMSSAGVEFGDSGYQRYLHSAAAAAELGIADPAEGIGMPNSDPTTGDMSAFQYLVGSPPHPPAGVFPASTLFADPPLDPIRMLRRSTQPELPPNRRGSLSLSRSHPYIPALDPHGKTAQQRGGSSSVQPSTALVLHKQPATKPQTFIIPAINQDGSFKRCTNCMTATTPSWRRHPETQALLCNACGLYLRLHRKPRPITVDESGNVQVIRKNAAVQREPMNLASSTSYAFGGSDSGSSSVSSLGSIGNLSLGSSGSGSSSSDTNFDQFHPDQPLLFGSYSFPGYQMAQRTNTSLASLQGIVEPFSPMELCSATPSIQQEVSLPNGEIKKCEKP